jgi:hypothetical protein
MSQAGRKALVVESDTSGTGALFVHAARERGFRPVLVSASPGRYAFVHAPGAPEVIELARMDQDALDAAIRSAPAAAAELVESAGPTEWTGSAEAIGSAGAAESIESAGAAGAAESIESAGWTGWAGSIESAGWTGSTVPAGLPGEAGTPATTVG